MRSRYKNVQLYLKLGDMSRVHFFKTDFTNYLLSFINVENFKETASVVEPAIGEEVRQGENGK